MASWAGSAVRYAAESVNRYAASVLLEQDFEQSTASRSIALPAATLLMTERGGVSTRQADR